MKEDINLKFFSILTLLLCYSLGQQQMIQKTIQILPNEQYYLDLSSFYSQNIQEISLPQSTNSFQSILPSLSQSTPTIQSMNYTFPSSYPISDTQKNVACIIQSYNGQQNDYYLVFGSISIQNNQIISYELDRLLILTAEQTLQTSVSLYSSTQGLAFLTDYNYTVFQFTFNQTSQKLSIQSIQNEYLIYKAKTFQQLNQIIITSLFDNNYFIYTFQQNEIKQIFISLGSSCQNIQQFQELNYVQTYQIFRDCDNQVVFLSDVYFSLNISSSSSYNQIFSQQINNQIMLTFIDYLNVKVCSLKYSTVLSNNSLNFCNDYQINGIFTTGLVLSNNLLLLGSSSQLQILDLSNSRIIFKQIAPLNIQYSLYNFLNNFALIAVSQKSGEQDIFQETQSIQFFQPAIIIKGQVDQPIQFEITVEPIPMIYKTSLTVKVVSQPQIQFQSSAVTIGYKFSGQSYNNSYVFYQDIENYVLGQNLSQINLNTNNQNISNLSIIQFHSSSTNYTLLQNSSDYVIFQIQQTSFNALLQKFEPQNQQYSIYYCNINNSSQLNMNIPLNYTLNSPIDFVDSQGSFNIQSDSTLSQKMIFLPILDNLNNLLINAITVQCDNNQYFTFSSDISANILITQCGSIITSTSYQPSFQSPFQPILISQNIIQYSFPSNSQIITINGTAFIYSSSYIKAYDYVNQILIGNTINLPALSQLQNVIIFKDSFFIYYQDKQSNPIINQYSYNSFQASNPISLRSLYTDSQNFPNLTVQPIILYSSGISQQYLLFQQLSYPNKYMVYRVNHCSSQNQFYGILQLQQSKLNIYAEGTICQLQQTFNCYNILQSSQISIKLQLADTYYQSQILLPFNFTMSQNELNQTFNFILRRDTSAAYGLVNQQSPSIQTLKTQIQDSKSPISSNQVFQLQDGSDPSIFNCNLLGWQFSNSNGTIQNRVQNQTLLTQNQNQFKILQNQDLIVNQDSFQIGSLVIANNINLINCVGLEDTSQTRYKLDSTDLNLYFICQQQINIYSITLILQNESYNSFSINSSQIYQLFQDIPYPNIYTKIFSSSSQDIRLFGPFRTSFSQITLDEQQKQATIYKLNLNSEYIVSENIIYAFGNLILIFYPNGNIITTFYDNIDPQLNNLFNLKNILQQYYFVISQEDFISQVLQVSDTTFNIQFQLSYIFQVTFIYQENNLQISQVKSFDYLDGFITMLGYSQSPDNQIFIGQNQNSEIVINSYNIIQNQNCYTINGYNSNYFSQDVKLSIFSINYSNKTSQYSIYLSNQNIYQISIKQNTNIILQQQQINQKQFSICPILANIQNNQVSFLLSQIVSFSENKQIDIIMYLVILLLV
ncbi:hypothetical protein ABPG74_003900 [Tetrahymena malaccensis]